MAVAELDRELEVDMGRAEFERDDVYLPTREEILASCREIQAEWTESERARRARGQAGKVRQIPVSSRRFVRILLDRRDSPDERAA
ncbi:hypothetical protein [Planctomicrobium sp. SH664]|uniref:hypothetical protein n=1 Tax=Planctomicrobium sp. SH664 TaxID=3448125 RepID=UPI003F5C376A